MLNHLTIDQLEAQRATAVRRLEAVEYGQGLKGFMAAGVFAAQVNMIDAELSARRAEVPHHKNRFCNSAYVAGFAA